VVRQGRHIHGKGREGSVQIFIVYGPFLLFFLRALCLSRHMAFIFLLSYIFVLFQSLYSNCGVVYFICYWYFYSSSQVLGGGETSNQGMEILILSSVISRFILSLLIHEFGKQGASHNPIHFFNKTFEETQLTEALKFVYIKSSLSYM